MEKVEWTRIRGKIYHLKLKVPVDLEYLYPGKQHIERSLKTSDPATARKLVRLVEADLYRQSEARKAEAANKAALAFLAPEQRALYLRSGGLKGLIASHQRSIGALAFMDAADPSRAAEDDEDRDVLAQELEVAEHRAALAVLTNAARREAKTLKALGEAVAVPGGDVTGLRELAEAFFAARGTPKLTQRAFLC